MFQVHCIINWRVKKVKETILKALKNGIGILSPGYSIAQMILFENI